MRHVRTLLASSLALSTLLASAPRSVRAQDIDPNPAPKRAEGDGPFDRLIIRGATLIDGTGAPPRGPVDIVVEKNRITSIVDVGFPGIPIDPKNRPKGPAREIDASGMYVMPGLVDLHVHTCGKPKAPEAEYCYKLWMAHGITTVRGVPFGSMDFSLSEKGRSARNEITAPRMWVYQTPFDSWDAQGIASPDAARAWVRDAAKKGIDGLKLTSYRPTVMGALLDEAKKLNLGSTAHLAQTGVAQMNASDAVRLGLGSVTHYYGLFEAMYENNDIQPYPDTYNYNDEQWRFGQVARQWNLVEPRGAKWKALLDTLRKYDATLDPTMTAYLAGRDVMARRTADWHDKYTLPSLTDFYTPNKTNHGAYFYDWTTADEVAWRKFFQRWMLLLNDYKNMGGRVTASSDAGFIYNTYGFSTIQEMELLQEAGFSALEVIRGATLHGAETLVRPSGREPDFGAVRPGYLADLVIVPENPVANLKVLYGTGAVRLDEKTGQVNRVGGIRWTIKDGIVYDAHQMLADIAKMVDAQKAERAKGR